jgi:TrmH family RNA methyltransferase
VRPIALFFADTAAATDRAHSLLRMARDLELEPVVVDPELMSAMADTDAPQGVLAVFPFLQPCTSTHPTLTLVIDQVRDPGNLGTLLRSADAAGVDDVLLTRRTVDIYNSKVVRAGMGSHFRLPFRAALSWEEIRHAVDGMSVALADARGDTAYCDIPWHKSWALIVGGEAKGASPEACSLADRLIRIPCREGVESLNAAVAGSVILFEARRQRNLKGTV